MTVSRRNCPWRNDILLNIILIYYVCIQGVVCYSTGTLALTPPPVLALPLALAVTQDIISGAGPVE